MLYEKKGLTDPILSSIEMSWIKIQSRYGYLFAKLSAMDKVNIIPSQTW